MYATSCTAGNRHDVHLFGEHARPQDPRGSLFDARLVLGEIRHEKGERGSPAQSPRCGVSDVCATREVPSSIDRLAFRLTTFETSCPWASPPQGNARGQSSARELGTVLGLGLLVVVPTLAQDEHERRVGIGEVDVGEARAVVGAYAGSEGYEAHVIEERFGPLVSWAIGAGNVGGT